MKKPVDPRNHGLKEPKKTYSRTERITLADLDDDLTHKVPLKAVLDAWNKALTQIESQGARVSEGPYFESSSFYGSALALVYTYEWDNVNYETEKATFDATMSAYLEDLARYKELEAQRRQDMFQPSAKNVDWQIERTERRLANLKAVKAGEPIPFPEG